MGGQFKRGEVHRFCVDLTPAEDKRLEDLATLLGVTKGAVVRRLIEVASVPKREAGQKLCVCDGERRVLSDLVGV